MEDQIQSDTIQSNTPSVQPVTQPFVPPTTNESRIILFVLLGLIVGGGLAFAGVQIGKGRGTNEQPIFVQPTVFPTQTIVNPTITSVPPEITSMPTVSSVTPTVNPTADWKTYTNTKFDYSLRLPANWTNFSMNDFSIAQFTNIEKSLYLGPKEPKIRPPQLLQITAYIKSDYRESEVYSPESCTVTNITIGIDQIQATRKICTGMESNGFITIKTSKNVFIIDELKGSVENHQLFNQILSTFKSLE